MIQGTQTPRNLTGGRWREPVAGESVPGASVRTRDIGRALDVGRRASFGTIWINDHLPLVSEMPWTWRRQSGYGRDMSRCALEDYTQVKHVIARLG